MRTVCLPVSLRVRAGAIALMMVATLALGQAPKAPPVKRQITAEEKVYFAAAGGYLTTARNQGLKLAKVMAGASNGTSTLTDIENAVTAVTRVENAGYAGDYKAHFKTPPPVFATVAPLVDEAHRLFQSAMTEHKKFFKTQNPDYIVSAQGPFKRSVELLNKALAELSQRAAVLTK